MSKQRHPSYSSEQQLAHKEILSLFNEKYQLKLESRKLLINDTLFQVDDIQPAPNFPTAHKKKCVIFFNIPTSNTWR